MKLKKIKLKVEKRFIKVLKIFNRYIYNVQFYQYLQNLGVKILGSPGFISDDVWADEVAPDMITIEEGVIISKGVTLLVHDYSVQYPFMDRDSSIVGGVLLKPIHIKKNAFIGANVTILPGTTIGVNTIIGSGSVIKGNVPDNVVMTGNPAKIIKTVDEYYEKIKSKELDNIKFTVR